MKPNWSQLIKDLRSDNVDRFNDAWKKLSELADETTVPVLYLLLNDESISVRETAANMLSRLDGAKALPLIFQAYTRGFREGYENEGMTKIIVDLLEENQEDVTPLLLDMLNSKDSDTLQNAAWALGFVSSQISPTPLIELINNNTNFKVRATATASLGSFKGYPEVFDQLVLLLKDSDFYVKDSAVIALGNLGEKRAVGLLQEMKKEASEIEQMSIHFALEKLM